MYSCTRYYRRWLHFTSIVFFKFPKYGQNIKKLSTNKQLIVCRKLLCTNLQIFNSLDHLSLDENLHIKLRGVTLFHGPWRPLTWVICPPKHLFSLLYHQSWFESSDKFVCPSRLHFQNKLSWPCKLLHSNVRGDKLLT